MGLQSQMKDRALWFPRQWEDVGAIRYASLVQPCGYCHPCCKWILQFRMQCIEIIIFLWRFGSPRSESKTLVRPALEWTSWEDAITVIWWDSHIERIWKMLETMIVALYKKIHTKKTSKVVVLSVPAVLSHSNNIQRCTSRIYTETLCIPRYKKCQCVWGKRNAATDARS